MFCSTTLSIAQAQSNKSTQTVAIEKLLGDLERNNLLLAAMTLEREIEWLKKNNPQAAKTALEGIRFIVPELSEFETDISNAKKDPSMAESYASGLQARIKEQQSKELLSSYIEEDPRFREIVEGANLSSTQRMELEKEFFKNGGYAVLTGSDLTEKLEKTLFNPNPKEPTSSDNTSELIFSSLRDRYKIYALSEYDFVDIRFLLPHENNGQQGIIYYEKTKGMLVFQMYVSADLLRDAAIEEAGKAAEPLVQKLSAEGLEARIDEQRRSHEQMVANAGKAKGLPIKKVFKSPDKLKTLQPVNILISFDLPQKISDKDGKKGPVADQKVTAAKLESVLKELFVESRIATRIKKQKEKDRSKPMTCKSLF